MKMKLIASVAALVGALSLGVGSVQAAPHFSGGGGGQFAGAHMGGGHFAGTAGGRFAGRSWAGHGWHGHDHDGDGWRGRGFWGGWGWGPGWGWGDPFFWGGVGFVAGYDLAPYGYGDPYDDSYDAPASAAPPPGYDCDGWRWDAGQNRYVAAKVACN